MICPRCSFHQPDAPDCGRCGLVLAKWNPDTARRPKVGPPPLDLQERTAKRAAGGAGAVLAGGVVLAAGLAAAAYWLLWPSAPPESPALQSTASVSLAALEAEASAIGCPRRVRAPGTIVEKALSDPLPPGWLNDEPGWVRATGPDRAPGAAMVVYFGVPWCKYSKAFERDVLGDAAVASATASLVKVRINPDVGETEARVADDFGVKVYPTVVVVAADGSRRRVEVLRDVGEGIMLGKAEDFVVAVSGE